MVLSSRSFRHCLLLIECWQCWEWEEEEICVHKRYREDQKRLNKKPENNTNRGCVTSLCALAVTTQLVLHIIKFVFPEV